MIFAAFPLAEALGVLLAHSVHIGGRKWPKGRVLTRADLDQLAGAGIERVIGAKLEDNDVGENEAAKMVAERLAGPGLAVQTPFTGRCNLVAAQAGLARIDPAAIDRLNRIDEAVTVATVAANEAVAAGQIVATVKIIPFAVPRPALDQGLAAVGESRLAVLPFRPLAAALILTTLPGLKPAILDNTARVTRARLAALGGTMVFERICAHDEAAIAAALAEAKASGAELFLISGASATVDRRDVVPAAIVRAGGELVHFGMPVDPGNLLLLARLADRPVIDMPGCARSPRPNGFDWVLARLFAGLDVGRADIMGMGAGGLLKEIASRPTPRDEVPQAPHASTIAALVLAAGQPSHGDSLAGPVRRVVEAALASRARPVVVVVGHQAEAIKRALAGLEVRLIDNPHYAQGIASSLKAGLAALPATCDGTLVMLGDMPLVGAAQLDRLIGAFAPAEGRAIIVPTRRGKRGNPNLWARRFFAEMNEAAAGNFGPKHLIGIHAELVAEVEMEDDAVLTDIERAP
ncbi:MAG: molybdopterin-binding/glycosyltransferase family 2 protein [Rhodospirillales bacterium]|nr:molybdopterin-binding/glycosyltransferase family 2 protein [Rhodospirillales bacterium]